MRRRSRHNLPKLFAYAGVLALCLGGLGYAGLQVYGKPTADRYGCYAGLPQPQTLVLLDASEPRFSVEQARSVRRYLDQVYERLGFNERLSVYTSEADQVASVPRPRFHVCGQASSPEQLEAVGAPAAEAGYLKRQRERLYAQVLAPELDALLADQPEASRQQLYQSPILELLADLSRAPEVRPGSRLILVSDLIENSDSAHFCRVQGDMPSFATFRKRPVYQRLKPQSMEGVKVEVLMLQRPGYGQGGLRFCRSEEEVRAFWRDYLKANGVEDPRFIRIRYGVGKE